MFKRAWVWIATNVLGVLIIVYFIFRFAVVWVGALVVMPISFFFQLFGNESLIDGLDDLIGVVDRRAWAVHDRVERGLRISGDR